MLAFFKYDNNKSIYNQKEENLREQQNQNQIARQMSEIKRARKKQQRMKKISEFLVMNHLKYEEVRKEKDGINQHLEQTNEWKKHSNSVNAKNQRSQNKFAIKLAKQIRMDKLGTKLRLQQQLLIEKNKQMEQTQRIQNLESLEHKLVEKLKQSKDIQNKEREKLKQIISINPIENCRKNTSSVISTNQIEDDSQINSPLQYPNIQDSCNSPKQVSFYQTDISQTADQLQHNESVQNNGSITSTSIHKKPLSDAPDNSESYQVKRSSSLQQKNQLKQNGNGISLNNQTNLNNSTLDQSLKKLDAKNAKNLDLSIKNHQDSQNVENISFNETDNSFGDKSISLSMTNSHLQHISYFNIKNRIRYNSQSHQKEFKLLNSKDFIGQAHQRMNHQVQNEDFNSSETNKILKEQLESLNITSPKINKIDQEIDQIDDSLAQKQEKQRRRKSKSFVHRKISYFSHCQSSPDKSPDMMLPPISVIYNPQQLKKKQASVSSKHTNSSVSKPDMVFF